MRLLRRHRRNQVVGVTDVAQADLLCLRDLERDRRRRRRLCINETSDVKQLRPIEIVRYSIAS